MKYLVVKLFSGVGLCNQLFSLETAIYMANIMNRKLILLIPHPLCHVGHATWDHGYLLNFFEDDYLKYLPNGIEVYYKDIPEEIEKKIKTCKSIAPESRFSQTVLIDKDMQVPSNIKDIEKFCNYRTQYIFDINSYTDEYVFLDKLNASRCFTNFYTKKENYLLMFNICCALKFKQIFYDIADKIYTNLCGERRNSYKIFAHLRFGDHSRKQELIECNNQRVISSLTEFIDAHTTNMIKPDIFFLLDSNRNVKFNNAMKKYNFRTIDTHVSTVYDSFIKNNDMVFYSIHEVKKNNVAHAIIEMLVASKANDFIGMITSTFSNYIQFLRYCNNKSYYNYSNLNHSNEIQCRLREVKESPYEWIRLGYSGGHPISWQHFWNPFPNNSVSFNLTSEGKWDGFGSQLQAVYSLVAYCEFKNYNYVHTEFHRMHHNYDNNSEFPKIMNRFVNLEHKFRSYNSLSSYEKSKLFKFREGYLVHGSFKPDFFYNKLVLKKLRDCYYSSKKPDLSNIYLKDRFNIAIHIRRGDVSNKTHVSRYTSNIVYIELLKKIKIPSKTFTIHIFSQGDESDFKEFSTINDVKYHLNTNIEETFHCLVKADLLIICKSSFSYCAALLNENMVNGHIIKDWWHKPLKNWI